MLPKTYKLRITHIQERIGASSLFMRVAAPQVNFNLASLSAICKLHRVMH